MLKETALRVGVAAVATALIWTATDAMYEDLAVDAPEPSAPVCPRGGVRVTAGPVEAAMGLRAMSLTLHNCGTRAYRVDGYPELRFLDADQQTVTGVRVVHGSGGITSGTGLDDPPRPVTVAPGRTATAGMVWRNTVTGFDGAVDIPRLAVTARPGGLGLLVAPDGGLDVGTTGKVGLGPWRAPDEGIAE